MTTRLTMQADAVLNLTEWAREEVEHANAEEAWEAYYADRDAIVGKEVYVTTVEAGYGADAHMYDHPVKAQVIAMAEDEVNMNYDEEWVYIDPFVDVDVREDGVPHGVGIVYGRTHKWRKNNEQG
jgi:hypothetical protein